ncbi:hypothetical protein [Streptomyces sp. KLOTTS4A1]|uniref:hypothetical protein n=1 Tax=Streptomyces sp. KLOTTS4A1 TaxID=3390996 RepID=UPI0039F4B676
MISEPELIGADGEPVAPADVVEPPPPPARPTGRRPWLWALGGALVASAVWAGTLYELGKGPATDLKGYELPEDLCTSAKLSALASEYGKRTPDHRAVREDPALDRAWCDLRFGDPQADGLHVMARVEVALHKKTDPASEFEVLATQSDWRDGGKVAHEPVSGLGDQAVYMAEPDMSGPQLQVREGAVVLRISLSTMYTEWVEEDEVRPDFPEADFSGVQAPMVADMKDLMAELKK